MRPGPTSRRLRATTTERAEYSGEQYSPLRSLILPGTHHQPNANVCPSAFKTFVRVWRLDCQGGPWQQGCNPCPCATNHWLLGPLYIRARFELLVRGGCCCCNVEGRLPEQVLSFQGTSSTPSVYLCSASVLLPKIALGNNGLAGW